MCYFLISLEENVKIRTDQVHPLDSDSAPYIFSSSTNPLLHTAARALNLPARSTKSYLSLFENASHMSPSRSNGANGSTVPPLEERYTGYFLISGYNVCFVLPKEFPPRSNLRQNGTDSENDALGRNTPRTPYRRRNSISDRNTIQFMAALDLWIPLSSKVCLIQCMKKLLILMCKQAPEVTLHGETNFRLRFSDSI